MRRILAALALLGLGACATTGTGNIAPGARYVALGSSFASGPGTGATKPGTPARCTRSERNYATLLAARLGLSLDDQSCGGATTAHITDAWDELPAQIDAVTPGTRLVTITIGGNDVGYVMNLFGASCRAQEGLTYQGRAVPCPPQRPPQADDYRRLENSLQRIAQEVSKRAPRARLVFVQYVRLVPDAPCPAAGLSPEGALLTRTIGEQLVRITARVAREHGAEVLDADRLSRRHTPCDAEPWSVGPKPLGEGANTPWHPNAAGMKAIADALADMLGK